MKKMEEQKKINLSITDGTAFFAHEASINFSPVQFILDFKCVTPRIDPRSEEAPTMHMAHNVIMLDPFHAKKFYELLGQVIAKFEKDFGKLEQSKALKVMEKKVKKEAEKLSHEDKSTGPNYFG